MEHPFLDVRFGERPAEFAQLLAALARWDAESDAARSELEDTEGRYEEDLTIFQERACRAEARSVAIAEELTFVP